MTVRFSTQTLSLLGTGSALPGPAVGNDELVAAIQSHCGDAHASVARKLLNRLGINHRHLSRDLATPRSGTLPGREAPELCRLALTDAAVSQSASFLIGHTSTPHTLLPPNIAWVAEDMKFAGPYLEIRQACTGFASALTTAAGLIADNPGEQVGIVGSETGSPFFEFSDEFIDREQLVNCVQMGDGAGAALVAADDGSGRQRISDIYTGHIGIDKQPGISLESGGSADPRGDKSVPYFKHRAGDVRKSGEALLLEGIRAMQDRGYSLQDFDWVIPHQVNGHIAALFAARIPELDGKVFVIADETGNLGSAAIWVGLDQLRRSGRLQRGQKVLILGAEASKYMVGGFVYTH